LAREGLLRVALTLEQCWHRVPGGTAAAALGIAKALQTTTDVDLVGVAAAHRKPAPRAWRPEVPVEHLPVPRGVLYQAWHYLRLPRVERATGPVDVIHATSLAMPPRSAPLLVTIHDLAFLHNPNYFTAHGLRFFKRGFELARREADLIMCPSRATLEDCMAFGLDETKLRLVPLGISPRPATRDAIERAKNRFDLHDPFVLWAGTIEPRKNLARLIRAFSRIQDDVRLVLAGPTGWNEALDQLISADKRIRRIGFIDRRDLDALYAGAAAVCWPSLLEGFGFPVLEAMAQGAPVVTSRGTSTEELVGDAGILVDPLDEAEIATAMGRLLADGELAASLRTKARERAALFTWDRTAQLLNSAYSEIAQ
jgi:glycosyltransferase involved in cell wall biosynthesis